MSPATASICAVTRSADSGATASTPLRVLRGDGGDRAGAVDAERGERLQVGLDAGAAARVAARDCQRCTHTLRSARHASHFARRRCTAARRRARSRAAEQARRRPVRDRAHGHRGADQRAAAVHAGAVHVSADGRARRRRGARRRGSAWRARFSISRSGIAGLPVFAASPLLPQGAARLLGPTGGYLMSYPLAAFVAGSLAERGFDRRYLDRGPRDGLRASRSIFAGGVSVARRSRPRPARRFFRARSPPASSRSSSPTSLKLLRRRRR